MTVGRPRIFDEDQISRDDATLMAIFDAGVDAGYKPSEMSNLVVWLRGARPTPLPPSSLAKYRRILAELVPSGMPPKRHKRGAKAGGLAIAALSAAAIRRTGHPEPLEAARSAVSALAPIMYDEVNPAAQTAFWAPLDEELPAGGQIVTPAVRTECTPPVAIDAHRMATAA